MDFPTGEEGKTGLQVRPMGHPQLKCPINDCTVESPAFRAFVCTKIERRPRAKTSSEDLERRPRAKISSVNSSEDLERRSRAKISSENSSEDLERIGGASND